MTPKDTVGTTCDTQLKASDIQVEICGTLPRTCGTLPRPSDTQVTRSVSVGKACDTQVTRSVSVGKACGTQVTRSVSVGEACGTQVTRSVSVGEACGTLRRASAVGGAPCAAKVEARDIVAGSRGTLGKTGAVTRNAREPSTTLTPPPAAGEAGPVGASQKLSVVAPRGPPTIELMRLGAFAFVLLLMGCSSGESGSHADGGALGTESGASRRDAGDASDRADVVVRDSGGGATDGHPGSGDAGLLDAKSGDAGLVATATVGLQKVLAGEYATHFLIDGQIYAFGATSYEGVMGAAIPAVPIDVPSGTTFVDGQSGLHQSVGLDSTGHVWTWGDDWYGDQGNGIDGGPTPGALPFRIVRDNVGNDFDQVVSVTAGVEADGAIKSDGTVWIWGYCDAGLAGNGSVTENVVYPTQVAIPFASGVKATKLLMGTIALVLASDGSVWAWGGGGNDYVLGTGSGTGYETPGQVKGLPSNITDIALGNAFAYALTSTGELYGWGYYGVNLGLGNWQASDPSCYGPTPTAIPLTTSLDGGAPALPLPHPVVKVVADTVTTHVILSDGTLWGWGDDAQGEVGDGQELDYWTSAMPFAWDFGQCELPVTKPVRIAKNVTSPFVNLWSNSTDTFYTYAITQDGQLYSWGRNKTGDLGNGVVGPNTHEAAAYPNSWDVTSPQPVAPMQVTHTTVVESPYCVKYADAGNCICPNGTLNGC